MNELEQTHMPPLPYLCRFMHSSDLQEVLEIENEYNPSPWKQSYFESSLKCHYCWVLEKKNKVVGYAILRMGLEEGEILNIAVHSDCRKQGLGQFLLNHLILFAEKKKVKTLFLEVRESNILAQALYQKLGFHQLGVRKEYYPSYTGRENGIILAKQIGLFIAGA